MLDNYATLKVVLRTLQGFILFPDSLGETNLKELCKVLNVNPVKK